METRNVSGSVPNRLITVAQQALVRAEIRERVVMRCFFSRSMGTCFRGSRILQAVQGLVNRRTDHAAHQETQEQCYDAKPAFTKQE